jgi:ion channel-forming bestrophin family protein
MLLMGLYAGILAIIDEHFFEITLQNTTTVHSLLGFVMSLFLIFRTNTAYERWWEGRKLWGAMVNDSRNLALKLSAFLPASNPDLRHEWVNLIANYNLAMKDHLREKPQPGSLAMMPALPEPDAWQHIPNVIARTMLLRINRLREENIISGEQFWLLEKEIKAFTDNIGACERIKNTPIPYSYSLFMKKFIFLYVMTLPLGFIPGFGYWTIPIVMFVFYVLVSIELLAEEIENPFGTDANDLPLEDICRNIRRNIEEVFSLQNPDFSAPAGETVSDL